MIQPLLIFILISVAAPTAPIQCWNCVGDDCDSYRASSNNWELVTCPVGSVCQKTNFMFYSNQKNKSIDISTAALGIEAKVVKRTRWNILEEDVSTVIVAARINVTAAMRYQCFLSFGWFF
ncbi:hypothetical protein CRE_24449 [Caenorhabditis remanei]|uniref:Uncharacterized protein n=1 Tax=Caenorhabditis remanei TaxID=31234 RepID=E3MFN9_CAERE|nr:hypothetical protein CRE_24449 [Caenorhabditis remanei]